MAYHAPYLGPLLTANSLLTQKGHPLFWNTHNKCLSTSGQSEVTNVKDLVYGSYTYNYPFKHSSTLTLIAWPPQGSKWCPPPRVPGPPIHGRWNNVPKSLGVVGVSTDDLNFCWVLLVIKEELQCTPRNTPVNQCQAIMMPCRVKDLEEKEIENNKKILYF